MTIELTTVKVNELVKKAQEDWAHGGKGAGVDNHKFCADNLSSANNDDPDIRKHGEKFLKVINDSFRIDGDKLINGVDNNPMKEDLHQFAYEGKGLGDVNKKNMNLFYEPVDFSKLAECHSCQHEQKLIHRNGLRVVRNVDYMAFHFLSKRFYQRTRQGVLNWHNFFAFMDVKKLADANSDTRLVAKVVVRAVLANVYPLPCIRGSRHTDAFEKSFMAHFVGIHENARAYMQHQERWGHGDTSVHLTKTLRPVALQQYVGVLERVKKEVVIQEAQNAWSLHDQELMEFWSELLEVFYHIITAYEQYNVMTTWAEENREWGKVRTTEVVDKEDNKTRKTKLEDKDLKTRRETAGENTWFSKKKGLAQPLITLPNAHPDDENDENVLNELAPLGCLWGIRANSKSFSLFKEMGDPEYFRKVRVKIIELLSSIVDTAVGVSCKDESGAEAMRPLLTTALKTLCTIVFCTKDSPSVKSLFEKPVHLSEMGSEINDLSILAMLKGFGNDALMPLEGLLKGHFSSAEKGHFSSFITRLGFGAAYDLIRLLWFFRMARPTGKHIQKFIDKRYITCLGSCRGKENSGEIFCKDPKSDKCDTVLVVNLRILRDLKDSDGKGSCMVEICFDALENLCQKREEMISGLSSDRTLGQKDRHDYECGIIAISYISRMFLSDQNTNNQLEVVRDVTESWAEKMQGTEFYELFAKFLKQSVKLAKKMHLKDGEKDSPLKNSYRTLYMMDRTISTCWSELMSDYISNHDLATQSLGEFVVKPMKDWFQYWYSEDCISPLNKLLYCESFEYKSDEGFIPGSQAALIDYVSYGNVEHKHRLKMLANMGTCVRRESNSTNEDLVCDLYIAIKKICEIDYYLYDPVQSPVRKSCINMYAVMHFENFRDSLDLIKQILPPHEMKRGRAIEAFEVMKACFKHAAQNNHPTIRPDETHMQNPEAACTESHHYAIADQNCRTDKYFRANKHTFREELKLKNDFIKRCIEIWILAWSVFGDDALRLYASYFLMDSAENNGRILPAELEKIIKSYMEKNPTEMQFMDHSDYKSQLRDMQESDLYLEMKCEEFRMTCYFLINVFGLLKQVTIALPEESSLRGTVNEYVHSFIYQSNLRHAYKIGSFLDEQRSRIDYRKKGGGLEGRQVTILFQNVMDCAQSLIESYPEPYRDLLFFYPILWQSYPGVQKLDPVFAGKEHEEPQKNKERRRAMCEVFYWKDFHRIFTSLDLMEDPAEILLNPEKYPRSEIPLEYDPALGKQFEKLKSDKGSFSTAAEVLSLMMTLLILCTEEGMYQNVWGLIGEGRFHIGNCTKVQLSLGVRLFEDIVRKEDFIINALEPWLPNHGDRGYLKWRDAHHHGLQEAVWNFVYTFGNNYIRSLMDVTLETRLERREKWRQLTPSMKDAAATDDLFGLTRFASTLGVELQAVKDEQSREQDWRSLRASALKLAFWRSTDDVVVPVGNNINMPATLKAFAYNDHTTIITFHYGSNTCESKRGLLTSLRNEWDDDKSVYPKENGKNEECEKHTMKRVNNRKEIESLAASWKPGGAPLVQYGGHPYLFLTLMDMLPIEMKGGYIDQYSGNQYHATQVYKDAAEAARKFRRNQLGPLYCQQYEAKVLRIAGSTKQEDDTDIIFPLKREDGTEHRLHLGMSLHDDGISNDDKERVEHIPVTTQVFNDPGKHYDERKEAIRGQPKGLEPAHMVDAAKFEFVKFATNDMRYHASQSKSAFVPEWDLREDGRREGAYDPSKEFKDQEGRSFTIARSNLLRLTDRVTEVQDKDKKPKKMVQTRWKEMMLLLGQTHGVGKPADRELYYWLQYAPHHRRDCHPTRYDPKLFGALKGSKEETSREHDKIGKNWKNLTTHAGEYDISKIVHAEDGLLLGEHYRDRDLQSDMIDHHCDNMAAQMNNHTCFIPITHDPNYWMKNVIENITGKKIEKIKWKKQEDVKLVFGNDQKDRDNQPPLKSEAKKRQIRDLKYIWCQSSVMNGQFSWHPMEAPAKSTDTFDFMQESRPLRPTKPLINSAINQSDAGHIWLTQTDNMNAVKARDKRAGGEDIEDMLFKTYELLKKKEREEDDWDMEGKQKENKLRAFWEDAKNYDGTFMIDPLYIPEAGLKENIHLHEDHKVKGSKKKVTLKDCLIDDGSLKKMIVKSAEFGVNPIARGKGRDIDKRLEKDFGTVHANVIRVKMDQCALNRPFLYLPGNEMANEMEKRRHTVSIFTAPDVQSRVCRPRSTGAEPVAMSLFYLEGMKCTDQSQPFAPILKTKATTMKRDHDGERNPGIRALNLMMVAIRETKNYVLMEPPEFHAINDPFYRDGPVGRPSIGEAMLKYRYTNGEKIFEHPEADLRKLKMRKMQKKSWPRFLWEMEEDTGEIEDGTVFDFGS